MVQSNERAMALHEEREKLADVIRLITERLRQEGLIPTVAPYQRGLYTYFHGRFDRLSVPCLGVL